MSNWENGLFSKIKASFWHFKETKLIWDQQQHAQQAKKRIKNIVFLTWQMKHGPVKEELHAGFYFSYSVKHILKADIDFSDAFTHFKSV